MTYSKIQTVLNKYANEINSVEHTSDIVQIIHNIFNNEFGTYDLAFTMICFILCKTFKLRLNIEISTPPNLFSTYIIKVLMGEVVVYKTTISNDIEFITQTHGVDSKQKAIDIIDHCIQLDLSSDEIVKYDDYKIISNSKKILQEITFNL